jgi:hypothetical protein
MKTKNKKQRIATISFELPINGRSYLVQATPYKVPAGDIFYRINYNNGPVHVFGWDEGLDRFAETDSLADIIPPVIEIAIAGKLNQYASEMQHAA